MLNMVNMGITDDVMRIGSYSGELEDDLAVIIHEITTIEPMGIYGVSSITAERSKVLSYQEVSVNIQYKRTAEEMQNVMSVSGDYDLKNRMSDMFKSFSTGEAYYIKDASSAGGQDAENQLYAAWMGCGSRAVGLSKTSVDFYPENSQSYIVEVTAAYSFTTQQMEDMSQYVLQQADVACQNVPADDTLEKVEYINRYLADNIRYDSSAQRVVNETQAGQPKTAIYTAYGIFHQKVGAQSGFVLAASVMCDTLGVDHMVETGLMGGDIYSWISLDIEGERYIFDVTAEQNGREGYLQTKDEAKDLYLAW